MRISAKTPSVLSGEELIALKASTEQMLKAKIKQAKAVADEITELNYLLSSYKRLIGEDNSLTLARYGETSPFKSTDEVLARFGDDEEAVADNKALLKIALATLERIKDGDDTATANLYVSGDKEPATFFIIAGEVSL